jgi:hypothetical protein
MSATFQWSSSWRSARIRARWQLRYADGADASLDRPPHVRAGSGCVLLPQCSPPVLAVVQDDAHFIALVRLGSEPLHVDAIALAAGPGGLRQFDPVRGNKADKLDLEAIVVVQRGPHQEVWCWGSGSLTRREHLVLLTVGASGELGAPREVALPALYERLRAAVTNVGAVLNLEGACVVGDELWLWNRGNDALHPDRFGINVVLSLSLSSLLSHVDGGAVPTVSLLHSVALPKIAGVPLTITDAARVHGGCVLLAAAEASPNAIDDGEVVGAAVGHWSDEARRAGQPPVLLPLLNEDGSASLSKVEGIALHDDNTAWLVVDCDDPTAPAELLQVHFE